MGLIDGLIRKIKYLNPSPESTEVYDNPQEYCPRCYATLNLQKGYDPSLSYWICKGCGEMLINPEIEGNIVWICDECGSIMNEQLGFDDKCGEWKCTECGHVNKLDDCEVYASEDEFQYAKNSPYYGLSDGDALRLSRYCEEKYVGDRENVILVSDRENGDRFIKKLITSYDKSIYSFLIERIYLNEMIINMLLL